MGVGSVVKKVASKATNKVKNGIKNMSKKEQATDEVKQHIKKILIIKVGIPASGIIVLLACVSVILQSIFGDTNSSISVSSKRIKDSYEAGELQGDKVQIDLAVSLEEKYGSCIAFTDSQLRDNIYASTIKELEDGDELYYKTYTSNYGTITQEKKNDIVNKYNEIKDKENKSEEDYDIINFYNLSREGKFSNMISPYDQEPIYIHVLRTEKYNFNNIKWKAYYHDYDEVNDVSKDNMTYDTTYQLLYPTANANLEDLINITAPYIMTSRIPLAFMASAMYSSSVSDQSIGSSWVEQSNNEVQGRNNNVGNFSYEIIKHGYSDITINQYNLQSVTRKSSWLEYDTYKCRDSFKITKKINTQKDKDGNEIKTIEYVVSDYKDGTENLNEEEKTHTNTRWDDALGKEVYAKEDVVIDYDPVITTQYKLASAKAFDVKVSNSFDYQKYSQEDVDARENCTSVLGQSESEHKKVEDESKHYTLEEVENLSQDELKQLMGDDGSTESGDGTSYIVYSDEYNYQFGKKYEIERYWTDTVSANPTSQSKTLFSFNDVVSYNKNEDGDPTMDTISENDFKADVLSKKYYEDLLNEESTAINRIDMLNANPKVFLNYVDNSNKYSQYVGYTRSDYTYYQGLQYITDYLDDISEANYGTLPFVYGASFGFDVNATAPSSLSVLSGKALLKEFIRCWESGGVEPASNGDKYIVHDDGAGNPTVGYGVDLYDSGFLSKFQEAGYGLTIGSEIDKDFVDGIEDMIIEIKTSIVEANIQGLDLTEYQKHALICRAYNWWSNSFRDCYLEYWNQERDDKFGGEPDYSHLLYQNHMKNPQTSGDVVLRGLTLRRESEWTLFQTGHYYRAGIMDKWWSPSAGGSVLEGAEAIHTQYETESWTYYTELSGSTLYWNNIEKSMNNSRRSTCCATFVGVALYYAGIFSEEEMNSFNYNSCGPSFNFYSQHGEVITNYDDLEAGDIVFFDYEHDGGLDHVEIYAGDDTWYGAGSTKSIRKDSPYKGGNYWREPFAKAVRLNV